MSAIEHLALVLIVHRVLTDLACLATSILLQNVRIRIRILARKESSLRLAFPIVDDSFIRTGTFTFGEMNYVFITAWVLVRLSILLLIHAIIRHVFELLNLGLLIRQYWVFALDLAHSS